MRKKCLNDVITMLPAVGCRNVIPRRIIARPAGFIVRIKVGPASRCNARSRHGVLGRSNRMIPLEKELSIRVSRSLERTPQQVVELLVIASSSTQYPAEYTTSSTRRTQVRVNHAESFRKPCIAPI
jgi:hypothetical protein